MQLNNLITSEIVKILGFDTYRNTVLYTVKNGFGHVSTELHQIDKAILDMNQLAENNSLLYETIYSRLNIDVFEDSLYFSTVDSKNWRKPERPYRVHLMIEEVGIGMIEPIELRNRIIELTSENITYMPSGRFMSVVRSHWDKTEIIEGVPTVRKVRRYPHSTGTLYLNEITGMPLEEGGEESGDYLLLKPLFLAGTAKIEHIND